MSPLYVDAVLFAVAAVIPVISGGRAPLPDVVVVCVVLRVVVVNGTPAAESLAVTAVVTDVFLRATRPISSSLEAESCSWSSPPPHPLPSNRSWVCVPWPRVYPLC